MEHFIPGKISSCLNRIFLIVIIIVIYNSISFAQEKKAGFIITGGATYQIGKGNFAEYWNSGFNGGFGVYVRPKTNITIDVLFCRHFIPFNDKKFNKIHGLALDYKEGEANITTIMAGLIYVFTPGKLISPYVKAGIGIMKTSIEQIKVGEINYYWIFPDNFHKATKIELSFGTGLQVNFQKNACLQLGINLDAGINGNEKIWIVPVTLRLLF
ncbi:outer membrane beta-barrel protein [candidate division KSB1 bacterium]